MAAITAVFDGEKFLSLHPRTSDDLPAHIMLRFLFPVRLRYGCDSYRTLGLLTPICLPLLRLFLMTVAFYVWTLTQL
jgi:hypothetical protein